MSFSLYVTSNSLQPHGLQHARPRCPPLSSGACPSLAAVFLLVLARDTALFLDRVCLISDRGVFVLFFTVSCSFSTDTFIIWELDWKRTPTERVRVYFCWPHQLRATSEEILLSRFVWTIPVVRTWTTNHVKLAYECSAQQQGQYRLALLHPFTQEALLAPWLHPGSSR